MAVSSDASSLCETDFHKALATFVPTFEQALKHILDPTVPDSVCADTPDQLLKAIAHGVLAGGKRLRPFLVMQTAALFDVDTKKALPAALAVELVHCYSLMHDDLPTMDNDDLRRGRPTVHKAFDEATAILAGDGLNSLAFEILTKRDNTAQTCLDLIKILANAVGIQGMVAGQQLDLMAERSDLDIDAILQMQAQKTGALWMACFAMGARLGEADQQTTHTLIQFGQLCGRMYQLSDDILDITGHQDEVGKRVGKDCARGKKTLISFMSINDAQLLLKRWHQQAAALIEPFEQRAVHLYGFLDFMMTRKA